MKFINVLPSMLLLAMTVNFLVAADEKTPGNLRDNNGNVKGVEDLDDKNKIMDGEFLKLLSTTTDPGFQDTVEDRNKRLLFEEGARSLVLTEEVIDHPFDGGRQLAMEFAKNQYYFWIDCYHPGHTTFFWESEGGTNDKINMKIYDKNWKNLLNLDDPNGSNCGFFNDYYMSHSALSAGADVAFIDITTYGSDALMIDEAHLDWRTDARVRWGVESGGVWCVSQDTNDAFGGWKCYKGLRFAAQTANGYTKGKVYALG
jgi:hypothetical protein